MSEVKATSGEGRSAKEAGTGLEGAYKAICDAVQPLADLLRQIADAVQDIPGIIYNQKQDRKKWRMVKRIKLRKLLLDKRSRIHRCRNNCRKRPVKNPICISKG